MKTGSFSKMSLLVFKPFMVDFFLFQEGGDSSETGQWRRSGWSSNWLMRTQVVILSVFSNIFSRSRSSFKPMNKCLEDIWSHWSPRRSGKTTQSLLLIMETVAASLGLKITLKISLLLGHYFLGLLPFAAPT